MPDEVVGMFDDLDDPFPDLRTADTLDRVLTHGRALRRRRRLRTAVGVGVAAGAVLVAALVVPPALDGARPSTLVPAAPAPGQSSLPAPSAAPLPARSPATPVLTLGGDDLGVTELGRPRLEVVAAVSAALGVGPDDPDVAGGQCGPARLESTWQGTLRLAFDDRGLLVGWLSYGARPTTPSGITVGTTVQRLRQVYGRRLQIRLETPTHGPTYTVTGVDMTGFLSSSQDDGTVEGLANGKCVAG